MGARVLNDQAVDLRTPRSWTEDRPGGRVVRVTRQPSPADLARAAELDKQAQRARRDAVLPLQGLAKTLKNDPQRDRDPAKLSKWNLATAVYHHWLGELEKSAGSANAALRADPTSLDALDFLVDITRHPHQGQARGLQGHPGSLGRRRHRAGGGQVPGRRAEALTRFPRQPIRGSAPVQAVAAVGWSRRRSARFRARLRKIFEPV
jgi:hypothetical protein